MSVVTADGICDVFGRPDNTPWWFGSPVIVREGGNGHIVTSTRKRQAIPTDGRLRIELEPGPTIVEFDDESWLVIVPDSDITLWALIQASVSFPPDTPEQALINAVNAWLENHPDEVKGPPGDPAPAPLVTAAVAEWLEAHADEVKGPPGDDGEMTEAGTVELIEAHIVPTHEGNQTRDDVALSAKAAMAVVQLYLGALTEAMVTLTGDQTIDGEKTFTAKTHTRDIEASPAAPGSAARVRLNNGSGRSWDIQNTGSGQLALTDASGAKTPLSIDPTVAVDQALRILADLRAGTNLDMGGFSIRNIGNANQANGPIVADGAGLLPLSLMPLGALSYKGMWDAAANTPTLANGSGRAGDMYRVGTAGNRNLGAGTIEFQVGDTVIYDGTVWQQQDNSEHVASVAGLIGAITPAALRTALNLVIGTDVQAQNANLQTLAELAAISNLTTLAGLASIAALTQLAGLTPSNDDLLQRKSGLWVNRTLAQVLADLTTTGLPYDLSYLQTLGTRAVGAGSNTLGVRIPRACKFTEFAVRFGTADASGSTTVNVYKNGAPITPTAATATVASASQSASTPVLITTGGPWTFAAGDILTVNISAVGTTPGTGLVVDCKGVTA